MLTIRDMQPTDIPLLAAWMVTVPLWQRYGLKVESAMNQFEAGLARGDTLIVGQEESIIPAGFAWMIPAGAFGRSPYLRLIGVHPTCTSQGLGTQLLTTIETHAWTLADALFLLVSDFNERGQQFYERNGYTRCGALPDYVVTGITEYLYWKRRAA